MAHPPKPVVAILVLALVGGVGYWGWQRDAANSGTSVMRLSGTIEAVTSEVGFTVGGRVLRRSIGEGQPVKAGDVLVELDDRLLQDDLKARLADVRAAEAALADLASGARPEELAQAQAAARRAQAALAEVSAGARREEREAASATYARNKIQAQDARDRLRRIENLYAAGGISTQERDAARAVARAATEGANEASARLRLLTAGARPEQLAMARASAAQAMANAALVAAGARPQQLAVAQARLVQAKAAASAAQTRLTEATVRAPVAGMVLSHHVEPGEVVAPGAPAVSLAQLERVYMRGYIPETDLGRVKLGQQATVTTDTYPNKVYPGVISFLASEAEFTPRTVQTKAERVKLVYRLKIDLANPDQELKPGMPADAAIQLQTPEKP